MNNPSNNLESNFHKAIIISIPIEDFQTVIMNCVNNCLKNFKPEQYQAGESSEQLLTIKEASKFLNLSVPTLYGYSQRAEIPVSKRGGRLYFSKQDLIQWIKDGRKKTGPELLAEIDTFIISKRKK